MLLVFTTKTLFQNAFDHKINIDKGDVRHCRDKVFPRRMLNVVNYVTEITTLT